MSGVVDTNVLIHAVNRGSPAHGAAYAFVSRIRAGADIYYLTEGICYEFCRVTTHPRVFPRPLRAAAAIEFIQGVLASPSIAMLHAGDDHWTVLRSLAAELSFPAGNLFYDIRTVALMRENGVRTIYTADHDFLQFRDIRVIDPLATGT
jgi:hypothetical protein